MQLILRKDVEHLGLAGELVDVKAGYGANFLIPQGFAVLATAHNKTRLEHERRKIEANIVREKNEAEKLSARLNGMSVTLTRMVGEDDKLFGSVSAKDIAEAMGNDGVVVDRRQVLLDAPLKALGVFDVDIKLHRDVVCQVKVWVVAD